MQDKRTAAGAITTLWGQINPVARQLPRGPSRVQVNRSQIDGLTTKYRSCFHMDERRAA